MFKKVLKWAAIVLLLVIALFVMFVGPWPTYGSSDVTQEPYFKDVVAKIDENIKQSTIGAEVGGLEAGWSKRSIVPAIGTPLAGYGNREGKPSTGVRDEIFVRALALHEGDDTVRGTGKGRRRYATAAYRSRQEDLGLHQEEQAAG